MIKYDFELDRKRTISQKNYRVKFVSLTTENTFY